MTSKTKELDRINKMHKKGKISSSERDKLLQALEKQQKRNKEFSEGFFHQPQVYKPNIRNWLLTIIPIFVIVICAFLLFNNLVDTRERVHSAWAQVENVYQRRLDLVPILVDSVKEYTQHEQATLTTLTKARAKAMGAINAFNGKAPDDISKLKALESASSEVHGALARLLAVAEDYPDLKASQNFITLQDQLEGTENRIATERHRYNESARQYNAMLIKFPGNLMAKTFNFESKAYFKAKKEAFDAIKDPFNK